MNIEKYTERARGFIQSAQSLAVRDGHQRFSPLHMLQVVLDDSEGLAGGLMDRTGGNSRAILKATEDALSKLPKVSGSGAAQIYLVPELTRAFDASEKAAEKAGRRGCRRRSRRDFGRGQCADLQRQGAADRRDRAVRRADPETEAELN
jgi:ATP-dependent Clp protease ATP-binding subunit ClpA